MYLICIILDESVEDCREETGAMNVLSVEHGCAEFAGDFLNYRPRLMPEPGKTVSVFNKSMYLVAMVKVLSEVQTMPEDVRFKAKLYYIPTATKRDLGSSATPLPDWFRTAQEVLVVVPTNNKLKVQFYPTYMEGRI